jgi:glycosyltransferase involved in cell wall biosynthesis
MGNSKNKKKVYLSLIIPAYKQEKTIERDLERVNHVLQSLSYSYEIIVVVDGKLDKTFVNAQKVHSSKILVVGYPHNKGKGYAVRYGMANAKGEVIAFLDAGMDLDPNGLQTLIDIMKKNHADIVIGSKLHPLSKVSYPWQRKILSWGYRSFVKTFFGLSVGDTQVGMKVFRRKVLEDVLPRLLVKRYAFDIEMLAVAHYVGYTKIFEGPVTLKFQYWSSITSKNFWQPISHMLWDTAAVFYRLRILHYYDENGNYKWKYDPELNFKVKVG